MTIIEHYMGTCADFVRSGENITENNRMWNLPVLIGQTAAGVGDTMGGLVVGTFALIPSFVSSEARYIARASILHTQESRYFLSNVFKRTLLFFNPGAKIEIDKVDEVQTKHKNRKGMDIEQRIRHNGIITGIVQDKYKKCIKDWSGSDSLIKSQLGTRLLSLGASISFVVTRIVDFAIGIFALLGSMFTLGRWDKANEYGYRGLQVTGIVSDTYMCILHFINPTIGQASMDL